MEDFFVGRERMWGSSVMYIYPCETCRTLHSMRIEKNRFCFLRWKATDWIKVLIDNKLINQLTFVLCKH